MFSGGGGGGGIEKQHRAVMVNLILILGKIFQRITFISVLKFRNINIDSKLFHPALFDCNSSINCNVSQS